MDGLTISGTSNLKGSIRWLAIELIDQHEPEESQTQTFHTKQSDVWAFGMTVYVRDSLFLVRSAELNLKPGNNHREVAFL